MLKARCVALATVLFLTAQLGVECSLIDGYFYHVTALRGHVVGTKYHDLPRWFRQLFAIKHVRLTLYQYQRPSPTSDQSLVKVIETDENGRFDFGALAKGHYELLVGSDPFGDRFDIEVTQLPKATRSVTVDVSPISPDCTGGHEFIINNK